MYDKKVFGLWLFFAVVPDFQCTPVDLGICTPKLETCSCGGTGGYNIHLEIKQCTRFHKWKMKCGNCKDEPSQEQRCGKYEYCLECNANWNHCVRCKDNRYGSWCTGVCHTCHNGGTCHRETGRCVCPHGYQGDHCEELDGCPQPPLIANGHAANQWPVKIYPRGTSIMYQCNPGYIMQGNPIVFCQNNRLWTDQLPTCSAFCPLLNAPQNGFVTQTPLSPSARYSCAPGYELKGDADRTCGANATWLGIQPECVKIVLCPIPSPPRFGNVTIKGGNDRGPSPGSVAKFTCDTGYTVMGEDVSECTKNGAWTTPLGQCVPEETTCPHPGDLENGRMNVNGLRGRSFFQKTTTIRYSCDPLYYLEGNSTITCGENSTWNGSPPVCVKVVTCMVSNHFPHGEMSIFLPDPRTAPPVRRLPTFFNVTARLPSGPRFRTPLPTQTAAARSASLSLNLPKGHYHVGTRITHSCESPYYDLIGSKIRSCQSTGEWSGRPPTCVPICGRSGASLAPKVIQGAPSKEGQWPWQIGVSRRLEDGDPLGDWFIVCGGSLITEEWIVTAAHCVTYTGTNEIVPLDEFILYFGKYYRNDSLDDSHVQMRFAHEIQVHPDFDPIGFESDIALIRVAPKVTLTSRIQPVCLSDLKRPLVKGGENGTVIGWGMMEDGTYSSVLQHASVPVIANDQCQRDYRRLGVPIRVTANMICAGYTAGGQDSCSGDSGGPLVFENNNRWMLEGIVSWGSPFGCGNERQYGGYARVSRFINWIEHYI